mmetsp:Transcript_18813/g.43908  ORF Transcript_18813/g.43908 Transcript_18813/m.43908 type:complete len:371 (+) Transcript_18813:120-1232(+)
MIRPPAAMALASSEYLARALEQPPPPSTPARHPGTFTRWAAEANAGADAEAALSQPATSASSALPASAWLALAPPPQALEPLYKVEPGLNKLLALARVELSCLAVDGLVVPNNERLTDRSGVTGDCFRRAGPDIETEVAMLEEVRTGDAKLTRACALPAHHVIHTVGPRFNIKYRHAAEHALTTCYDNVLRIARENELRTLAVPPLHSERKGYPLHAGARVALRAIRRWLEKWGPGKLEVIVLAVSSIEHLEAYAEAMASIFPRNSAEEKLSLQLEGGKPPGSAVTEGTRGAGSQLEGGRAPMAVGHIGTAVRTSVGGGAASAAAAANLRPSLEVARSSSPTLLLIYIFSFFPFSFPFFLFLFLSARRRN